MLSNKKCYITSGALLLLSIQSIVAGPSSDPTEAYKMKTQCQERTGLTGSDILDYHKRNEGCAVDCTTRQGTIMSYHSKKGTKCGQNGLDYACIFGQCKPKGDTSFNLNGLYSVEIRILSAHVPDLDSLPMGGSSDVFVVVEANKYADPAYEMGDLMCHTYVVQDNSDPKWNFRCKPLLLRLTSRIKFDLFDSDKPSENPDHIGYAVRSVEDLINKGAQRLPLVYEGSEYGHDYHVTVEVTGQEEDQ